MVQMFWVQVNVFAANNYKKNSNIISIMRYFIYFCPCKSNVSVNEQGTWYDEWLEQL